MNERYRYIIFDADHTLLDFDADEKRALRAAFAAAGRAVSEAAIEDMWRFSAGNWERLGLTDVHLPSIQAEYHALYRTHVCGLFDYADGMYALAEKRASAQEQFEEALAMPAHTVAGAEELLKALSNRYRLCVATNGLSRMQHGRLSALSHFFWRVFISEEMGTIKPCRAFFSAMLSALGARAEECLFVGDSLASDIAGANGAGMDCVWFNRRGEALPPYARTVAEIHSLVDLIGLL